MTAKEALEYFKRRKEQIGLSDRVQQAEDLAIKALKKQIFRRAIPLTVKTDCASIGRAIWRKGTTVYECPRCSTFISPTYDFCFKCGQALDWSETE